MAYENSQGITFTFDGDVYTATSLAIQKSRGEIDATTIDMPKGSFRRFRSGKFSEISLNVEWLGMTKPVIGQTASFAISGQISGWPETTGVPNIKAICTNYSVNAQAGDIIRCSGTFKLSNE